MSVSQFPKGSDALCPTGISHVEGISGNGGT